MIKVLTALLLLIPLVQAEKIKVFILAGQSNMEGQGVVSMNHEKNYNGGKGNLEWSMKNGRTKDSMKHLKDSSGKWAVRSDVDISFKNRKGLRKGPLTIGFTGYGGSSHIGPELQIGHVLGDHFKENVLLIKTAWGGKSLSKDFRPPSSGGETGEYYQKMHSEIKAALAAIKGDYEIAGFIWMQGWNDMVNKDATAEYAENLVNFVKDVRKDLSQPNLPFVIGELGNMGKEARGGMSNFREQQKKGASKISNSVFVSTVSCARPKELSPNTGHGHHWFGNAESYFLIGEKLGKGMLTLLK